MAIYELTAKAIEPLSDARFADLGLKEREDLQRILRDRVDVVVLGADLSRCRRSNARGSGKSAEIREALSGAVERSLRCLESDSA